MQYSLRDPQMDPLSPSVTPGLWVLVHRSAGASESAPQLCSFCWLPHPLLSTQGLPLWLGQHKPLPLRPQGLNPYYSCASKYFSKSRQFPSWEIFWSEMSGWLQVLLLLWCLLLKHELSYCRAGDSIKSRLPLSPFPPLPQQGSDCLHVGKGKRRKPKSGQRSRAVWQKNSPPECTSLLGRKSWAFLGRDSQVG